MRGARAVAAAFLLAGAGAAVASRTAVAEEVPADVRRLLADRDPKERARGLRGLAERMDGDAAAVVLAALDDPDPYCRDYACWVLLGRMKDAAGLKLLCERGPRAATKEGRLAACDALAATGVPEALPGLLRLVRDRDPRARETAVDAIAALAPASDGAAAALLAGALADPAPGVRAAALEAAAVRKAEGVATVLDAAVGDVDPGVRGTAAERLAVADAEKFLARFPALAADGDWGVRVRACRAAAGLRAAPPVPGLAALLADRRLRVRDAAHDALRALSGLDLPQEEAEWLRWWEGAHEAWRPTSRRLRDAARESTALWHGLGFRSDGVLFVVDLSGSMGEPLSATDRRSRAEVARAEVSRTLNALRDGTHADVMAFTLEPDRCLGRLQPLTDELRRRMDAWFARREVGRRGDLGAALLGALADGDADTVLLLSDGAPSTGEFLFRERILPRVRQALRMRPVAVRCVAFGGRPADRQFLRDVAELSGGGYLER